MEQKDLEYVWFYDQLKARHESFNDFTVAFDLAAGIRLRIFSNVDADQRIYWRECRRLLGGRHESYGSF